MANSSVDYSVENRLRFACALIVKLNRIGLLTDALVAAATSFQDLLDDIVAAFFVGATTDAKYPNEVYIYIRALEAELTFMLNIGLLTNTIVTNLTTANTADAATDLFYCAQLPITADPPARTDESFVEWATGAIAYGANLG